MDVPRAGEDCAWIDPAYIRTRLHLNPGTRPVWKSVSMIYGPLPPSLLETGWMWKILCHAGPMFRRATTLDIYTHITNPMRSEGSGQNRPENRESGSAGNCLAEPQEKWTMTTFRPMQEGTEAQHRQYSPRSAKLLEGRYSPNVAGRQKALPVIL